MNFIELFLIAIGLSMDAFAVAICRGLALKNVTIKNALTVGLYFGFFQGAMPLIGYALGAGFADAIEPYDHWVAFVLLSIIGIRMLREGLSKEPQEQTSNSDIGVLNMLILAIATSIDAMAVGISFAFLNVNIVPAVCLIGIVTLLLSVCGVKIGNIFGLRFKSKSEIAGGIVLILIGFKILLEHLGII